MGPVMSGLSTNTVVKTRTRHNLFFNEMYCESCVTRLHLTAVIGSLSSTRKITL